MGKEKEESQGITVTKEEDMPEWYAQVIVKSQLADYSPVRGCMVIRPLGLSLWQSIGNYFNDVLERSGVQNAYFPLFIPESFFKKEQEHAKGFNPEVAWISNKDENHERLAIRPTSETIIYNSYAKWIRSWRDLPLRYNQWCNVVRWEVSDVKLFFRSREFLWQEGHCVYETQEECDNETRFFLDEYIRMSQDLLAIPVIAGKKTDKEKFAGAEYTYTIESLMPDGKALQMGTSHNLGQGFAKAFGISFKGKDGNTQIPWQNSWGFSTRLIGAVVTMHSDDKGLVLPPRLAPTKVVIVPIYKAENKELVMEYVEDIASNLENYDVKIDDRETYSPGWKFNEWELKGIPIRIEIGPKEVKENSFVLVRRDNGRKQKIKKTEVVMSVERTLESIQSDLYNKAEKFLNDNIVKVATWANFLKAIKNKKIAAMYFCGDTKCEDKIKEESGGAGSRCIPFDKTKSKGKCLKCSKSGPLTYFAKAY